MLFLRKKFGPRTFNPLLGPACSTLHIGARVVNQDVVDPPQNLSRFTGVMAVLSCIVAYLKSTTDLKISYDY